MGRSASAGHGHRPFELIVVESPMPRGRALQLALASRLLCRVGRPRIECLLDDRAEAGPGVNFKDLPI